MTKLLIATPAFGQIFYSPYVESIIKLISVIHRRGWKFGFRSISYAEIAESRNYLLTHWFDKTDASHLLFIDADMGFEPDLIVDMVEFGRPVVGVVYPKRSIDVRRVAEFGAGAAPDRAVMKAQEFVVKRSSRSEKMTPQNTFMEVEGCGAGVLMIERPCIETMLRKLPELSDPHANKTIALGKDLDRLIRAFDIVHINGSRLSEDYSFCHRWKHDCGGEVWVSIAHEITHMGLHQFKGRYSEVLSLDPASPVAPGQSVAGRLTTRPALRVNVGAANRR